MRITRDKTNPLFWKHSSGKCSQIFWIEPKLYLDLHWNLKWLEAIQSSVVSHACMQVLCWLASSMNHCVRGLIPARNPGPALGPPRYVSFWQKQNRNSGYVGISSLWNIKKPNFRIVRVEYTRKYFKISHLTLHFFLLKKKKKRKPLNFVSASFQNVNCPQQDFHKCLCLWSTFRILPWNKRMAGYAFCPCRNYLVSESGCEQAMGGSMDRWKNIYGHVQLCCSVILAASCGYELCSRAWPEHGPFWKRCENQGFFMHPLKEQR